MAYSRWLGYSSNVLYTWESGRRWPSASETMRAAGRAGVDVRAAFEHFYRTPPQWLDEVALDTPEGIARFLQFERGQTPILDIARRASRNRFSVSRWLNGQVEPRLPDFLRLVEAVSLRLLDLLTAMVEPSALPSAAEAWARLEAQRDLAIERPYTQAVLRAIELDSYQNQPSHLPGWIAGKLGITLAEEESCLNALSRAGQIRLQDGRWIGEEVTVDTRRSPESSRHLKSFWAQTALARLQKGAEGRFAYNVFSISQADYEQLENLHSAYFRALRTLVADSHPPERVVLANVQLVPLDTAIADEELS